jgi:hypothetical protein
LRFSGIGALIGTLRRQVSASFGANSRGGISGNSEGANRELAESRRDRRKRRVTVHFLHALQRKGLVRSLLGGYLSGRGESHVACSC